MRAFQTIFIVMFFILPLYASDKVTLFVLHSYSQEYGWTKKQHDGFVSTLSRSDKTFDFYIGYLDTKRLALTPQCTNNLIKHFKKKYANTSFNAIYVTDDNALNFIYENYAKLFQGRSPIPVFFSGVNNLNIEKDLPKNLFAGVYEIKDIEKNIELIKQFSPTNTRDILYWR